MVQKRDTRKNETLKDETLEVRVFERVLRDHLAFLFIEFPQ